MKKAKNYGITVAGVLILALAVLIIFLTIFVPHLRENKILKERADILLYAEYERVMLFDPLREREGMLADRGVEVMLLSEQVAALRESFREVMAAGVRNKENVSKLEGAWDIKWQLRTLEDTVFDLYFTKDAMYFYAEGTAFYFEPKDMLAYDAFYALVQQILEQ